MKQKTHKLMMVVLGVLLSINANAHDVEIGGIYYNLYSGGTAAVTYRGGYYFSYSDEYTGVVVIPQSINSGGITYSVTSIDGSAFRNCSGLTSLTIPNSVTYIDGSAFRGCSGLTSLAIPSSVTSIGEQAFSGCNALESITVDNANTYYDSRGGCNAIIETSSNTLVAGCKNTVIPSSVTSIGYGAFYNCSGLTSVTIPSSVTSIGSSAFWGCI